MGVYLTALFGSIAQPGLSWRQCRARGHVLRAAVDACDRKDERSLRRGRLLGVTRWAHFLLMQVPEAEILRLGDEAGRAALADAQASGNALEVRHMGYELAAMWGDPYVAGKTNAAYDQQILIWSRRGEAELGQTEGAPPSAWAMPEPQEALETSLHYWRIARDAQPEDPTVLIGLVEAAWMLAHVTSAEIPPDVKTALSDGLRLTAGDDADPVLRHRFLTFQHIAG
jgi:hypothetical protein